MQRKTVATFAAGAVMAALAVSGCQAQSLSEKGSSDSTTSSPAASISPAVVSPAAVATTTAALIDAASGLAESADSATTVQAQPASGACHASSTTPFASPDSACTPGALNPAVTQATIATTICTAGYSSSIRPAASITDAEKRQSMAAYGDTDSPSDYEYDHLVSLELGGAPNDPRNLWPEPQGSPNPKDSLEDRLHADVCDGRLTLAAAQQAIASNWVAAHAQYIGQPTQPAEPTTSAPAPATVATAPPVQAAAPTPAAAVAPAGGGSGSGSGSGGGTTAGSDHPAGATAQCNDGTYSYAAHHQGACSHTAASPCSTAD